jgi:hypothetical protein
MPCAVTALRSGAERRLQLRDPLQTVAEVKNGDKDHGADDEERDHSARKDVWSTSTPAKRNFVMPQSVHPAVLSPRTQASLRIPQKGVQVRRLRREGHALGKP